MKSSAVAYRANLHSSHKAERCFSPRPARVGTCAMVVGTELSLVEFGGISTEVLDFHDPKVAIHLLSFIVIVEKPRLTVPAS